MYNQFSQEDLADYIANKINQTIAPKMNLLDLHTEFADFQTIINDAITQYQFDFRVWVNIE